MLFILLSGKPPFDGDTDEEITEQVILGEYVITGGHWQVVSAEAKALIQKMLTYKYQDRVNARECLQDPWFTNASSATVDLELMKECMQNLSKFSATQKLQQATMSMMVQNMVTKEETNRLQQVFMQLDTNKDGKLQYNELMSGYEIYYGKDMAKEEVDRIFALVDVDHSNEIDFSEFVTATANRGSLLQEDKLKQAFNYYDRDNSG